MSSLLRFSPIVLSTLHRSQHVRLVTAAKTLAATPSLSPSSQSSSQPSRHATSSAVKTANRMSHNDSFKLANVFNVKGKVALVTGKEGIV